MSLETLKTAGYVNISYCVNQVLMDLEDFSERITEKAIQYAINIISSYNIFQSKNVEVAYLDIDDNGIVDLSTLTDYVDYVKIGIIIKGKVWILSVNNKIALRREELEESDALEIFKGNAREDIECGYYFAGHYASGAYITPFYGYGGGFARSYFRFDNESREFQFDTAVPKTQIVLEYLSSGVKLTGATVIPRYMVNYIVAAIHERFARFNRKLTRGEKADIRQIMLEEENMLQSFEYRFDIQRYLDMSYASQHQAPKR